MLNLPPALRFSWQSFPLAMAASKFHIIHNWKIAVSCAKKKIWVEPLLGLSLSLACHGMKWLRLRHACIKVQQQQQHHNNIWPRRHNKRLIAIWLRFTKVFAVAALRNCFFAMNNLTFLTFDLEKNTRTRESFTPPTLPKNKKYKNKKTPEILLTLTAGRNAICSTLSEIPTNVSYIVYVYRYTEKKKSGISG